jgi:putative transferase (TIGR04331 family)
MKKDYYLATTAISEIWDLAGNLLLLGPWCSNNEKNKKLLEGRDFTIIPSLWKPAFKIKEAADYCYQVYERLLPQLSDSLNYMHGVSYAGRYWQVLLGPWLLRFIEIFYDRYKRIEKVLELFPDFYTYALPREQCKLISFDTYDFLNKIKDDYYNLKLFSFAAYELCPHNIKVKEYKYESKIHMYSTGYSWKKKMFNRLLETLDLLFKSPILLCDMYHLTSYDTVLLKLKGRFKTFRFIDFEPMEEKTLKVEYSDELRKKISLNAPSEGFLSLLYKVLPEAIPVCYMENYQHYRNSIRNIRNIDSVKIVGSSVGWFFNERFKFFTGEAVTKGAKLIDFQHGGGYGSSLAIPREKLSLEKDIFYTWGWDSKKDSNIRPLLSPHLSKVKDTYSPGLDNILFVGQTIPAYYYMLHTVLLPNDMPEYFEDKKVFFQALPDETRNKILYRPYAREYGWKEMESVKKMFPDVRLASKGRLIDWMKKVKLAVIDCPYTAFIEALTINVPCVFYWDHKVCLMRPEAEEYFELLRNAGILFKDPLSAAKKVKEIFAEPVKWWLCGEVQKARLEFCNRYAYAGKDWLKIWIEELKQLPNRV